MIPPSYRIVWSATAVDRAAGFLSDDHDGLAALMDRIDELAADPRPEAGQPLGSEDLRRLRTGRYRVLYEIDDLVPTVTVIHVGRIG